MKRIVCLILASMLLLAACTSKAEILTWQEQYDLGVRYLAEGNYEEAILAFNAAIDIDPMQAPAFVARADAYASAIQYDMAEQDYLKAIELDNSVVETYLKLAELYMLQENTEAAIAILKQGLEVTGDEALQEQIDLLLPKEENTNRSETLIVRGTIIYNLEVYKDKLEQYESQYLKDDVTLSIRSYGVRFETPLQVEINGELETIQEVSLTGIVDEAKMFVGKTIEMTGTIYRDTQTEEFQGPTFDEETGKTTYYYRPNGEYNIAVDTYKLLP